MKVVAGGTSQDDLGREAVIHKQSMLKNSSGTLVCSEYHDMPTFPRQVGYFVRRHS